jgi:integrase
MATFRKRSNAWQARIQRSGYPDISKSFKSHSEALAWARKIESELDNGINTQQPQVNTNVLLKELLERYDKEVTSRKKHSSVETYRIKAWLRHSLANLPISKIKSADIARWRDERVNLGKSPNTIRLELAILSNLYTVAQNEWGYEELNNPTTKIKLPRLPSGRTRRLQPNEIEKLISSTESPHLKSIVTIALETGMRRTEIASLEWEYINLSKRTLLVPYTKNGEAREVPLSTVAIGVFNSLQKQSMGRVFNITSHAITIAFGRGCKRVGLKDLRFH